MGAVATHYIRSKLEAMANELDTSPAGEAAAEDDALEPLITLASALLDTDRLRIAARLVEGPANRMELAQITGLPQRDLLRQLGILQDFGLVRLERDTSRPDHYSRYELSVEAFRAARQAVGKHKGRKPRPTDARLMTLETFMPGGKLSAFPTKADKLVVILDEVAQRFSQERQYTEREVNVILEDINEDYCSLRRFLVDYGYLSRSGGIYRKNS